MKHVPGSLARVTTARSEVRKAVLSSDFRALFQTLTRSAVASSLGLAAGCGATTTPLDPEGPRLDAAARLPGPWVRHVCSEEDWQWPFEKTNLVTPVDYFAVYEPSFRPEQDIAADGGAPPERLPPQVLHGSACAGASQPAVCSSAIERELAATECAAKPCAKFVLATAGDSVLRAEHSALSVLLGAVDTETEALIVALVERGGVSCWLGKQVGGTVVFSSGSQVRAVEGGYEVQTSLDCYGKLSSGTTLVHADGSAEVLSTTAYCYGRRPDGLLAQVPCKARSELGAHFASAMHLEAASVFAFEQLADDLARLGAPSELVRGALRSALEEVGHTQTMGALAVRFGGELAAPRVVPPPARDALAVALENAVEGCVRETYGALVACYQAQAALDAQVRAAMLQVFEDETRHAELAWSIARWLEPRLSEPERRAVQVARGAAYVQLCRELESSLSADARQQLGVPDASIGATLLTQLDAAVGLRV